ncbi:MAG TPA: hypothetical protein VFZ67_11040 [Nitrososphaera sp.]
MLEGGEYLNTWEIDFTTTANRNKHMLIDATLKKKKKLKVR